MKQKRAAIACACILFAAILAVSASLICSVRRIDIDYSSSTKATTDKILQYGKELEKLKGKNILFVNEDELVSELSCDPYVKIVSLEVKIPFTLKLKAEERRESYCVLSGGKYCYIAEDGIVLDKRPVNAARADGSPLAYIKGDVPELTVGKGVASSDELFSAALLVLAQFEDARNEVEYIIVDRYNEDSESTSHNDWMQLEVKTKEGARFTVIRATELSENKAKLLYSVFRSLTGEDRVSADIKIFKGENNTVDYQKG